jgi:hypothetical protein
MSLALPFSLTLPRLVAARKTANFQWFPRLGGRLLKVAQNWTGAGQAPVKRGVPQPQDHKNEEDNNKKRARECVMFVPLWRMGFAFFALGVLLPAMARADVRVHGATTVAFGLLKPQQSRIEQLASAKIVILPSSTGNGLTDLAQGRADIAMLAEPLASAAAALNKKEPGLINPNDYQDRHVGDAWVQFIVHPSNPVQQLSRQQLAALYSGQIRNWSELGGMNQPVLLVGEPTSSPYRLIRDALAISYAPEMRSVQNTNQTGVIVAQAPGALSNISMAHDVPERAKFKVLDTEVKIPLRLYLAVRKDAPAEVARVVSAAAQVGAP